FSSSREKGLLAIGLVTGRASHCRARSAPHSAESFYAVGGARNAQVGPPAAACLWLAPWPPNDKRPRPWGLFYSGVGLLSIRMFAQRDRQGRQSGTGLQVGVPAFVKREQAGQTGPS